MHQMDTPPIVTAELMSSKLFLSTPTLITGVRFEKAEGEAY
jgi:hypothetical protein